MTLKPLRLFAAAMLPVLIAAACGTAGDKSGPKAQSYKNDGYLGISNSNPNLQNGPSFHTYEMDTNMMRDAVVPIAGVRKVSIMTHGPNATVKLSVPRESTDADMERIRGEALEALQKAVPRYNFDVTIRGE
ncbi:hypothetical protein [Paenibacillus ginsengarvi]|uniref:Sporulation protein n=1 Tax=Paenibacillus ginsengarvi TaxID=400777 RepID=A0A3B0CLV1_9BACL|nr:hypothetical protein [Paenibacillus ginsengarvi]RKN85718.1 hypothetical protein D7M11_05070 [Paenibacillus ginsengarvi]